MDKNLPAKAGTQVRLLIQEDPVATEQLSPWVTTPEPALQSPRVPTAEPTEHTSRARAPRSRHPAARGGSTGRSRRRKPGAARPPQPEKARARRRPSTPKAEVEISERKPWKTRIFNHHLCKWEVSIPLEERR